MHLNAAENPCQSRQPGLEFGRVPHSGQDDFSLLINLYNLCRSATFDTLKNAETDDQIHAGPCARGGVARPAGCGG